MKSIFVFLIANYVLCVTLFAQASKKAVDSSYSLLLYVNVAEVRLGKHLDLAKRYSLENFIEYYIRSGKESFTKKDGTLTIEELYKDSADVYFGHLYTWGMKNFFKVSNNDLNKVNYEEIDGKQLRKRFIDEVVPVADKERVEKKGWGCISFTGIEDFQYRYFRNTKEIEFVYHWKSTCDFVAKLINKTYNSRYNLDTKEFSPVVSSDIKGKK